jgi:DNA-binding response OmpR family regulator
MPWCFSITATTSAIIRRSASASFLGIGSIHPLAHSLVSALETYGIRIATARDWVEGLKVFQQPSPAVGVTDIIMPEQDGIGVIMAMRRERPGVKIIAMSGGGRVGKSDFLTIAKKLGADAVIDKPFDVDALVALIRAPRPAGSS